MSQADMATKLGVGVRTVRAWESGEMRPSCRSLRLIAAATGVSLDKLLAIEPSAPAATDP